MYNITTTYTLRTHLSRLKKRDRIDIRRGDVWRFDFVLWCEERERVEKDQIERSYGLDLGIILILNDFVYMVVNAKRPLNVN